MFATYGGKENLRFFGNVKASFAISLIRLILRTCSVLTKLSLHKLKTAGRRFSLRRERDSNPRAVQHS